MNKRIIEYEVKLEKSLKVILALLAIGVLLNAFSPIISAKNAFADHRLHRSSGGCAAASLDANQSVFYTCMNHEVSKDIHEEVVHILKNVRKISWGDCNNRKLCDGK